MVSKNSTSSKKTRPCPTCKKPVAVPGEKDELGAFPFCSDRCRTTDLGKWADEAYRFSRPIEQSDLDEE